MNLSTQSDGLLSESKKEGFSAQLSGSLTGPSPRPGFPWMQTSAGSSPPTQSSVPLTRRLPQAVGGAGEPEAHRDRAPPASPHSPTFPVTVGLWRTASLPQSPASVPQQPTSPPSSFSSLRSPGAQSGSNFPSAAPGPWERNPGGACTCTGESGQLVFTKRKKRLRVDPCRVRAGCASRKAGHRRPRSAASPIPLAVKLPATGTGASPSPSPSESDSSDFASRPEFPQRASSVVSVHFSLERLHSRVLHPTTERCHGEGAATRGFSRKLDRN